jgi:DNA-binding XRE family transcriptional regulator
VIILYQLNITGKILSMARKPISEEDQKRSLVLAARIQEKRKQANFTQEDLANASGVCVDTLRAIEAKKVPRPGVFTLSDLAEALGVELDELVPRKGELTASGKVRKQFKGKQ